MAVARTYIKTPRTLPMIGKILSDFTRVLRTVCQIEDPRVIFCTCCLWPFSIEIDVWLLQL